MPDGHETTTTQNAIITCPECGAHHEEQMPMDACAFFYECAACGRTLKPEPGDCCVYCSYANRPCPSMQR